MALTQQALALKPAGARVWATAWCFQLPAQELACLMLAAFGYVKCCLVRASPFSEIELNRPLRVPLVEGTGQLGVTLAPSTWSREPKSECGPQTHCLAWNQALPRAAR